MYACVAVIVIYLFVVLSMKVLRTRLLVPIVIGKVGSIFNLFGYDCLKLTVLLR